MCKIFEKYVTKWINRIRDHLDWFVTDIWNFQWWHVQIGFKLLLFSRRIFDPRIEFRNSESSKPNVEKTLLEKWRLPMTSQCLVFSDQICVIEVFEQWSNFFRRFMPKLCVENLCWQNYTNVRSFDCDRKLVFLKRFIFNIYIIRAPSDLRLVSNPPLNMLTGRILLLFPIADTFFFCDVIFVCLLFPSSHTLPCILFNLPAHTLRGPIRQRAAGQVVQAKYFVKRIWPLFLCLIRNSHKRNKLNRVSLCRACFITKDKPIFYDFPRFLTNNFLCVRYWPSLVWECSRITKGLMKSIMYRNLENGVRLSLAFSGCCEPR